MNVNLVQAEYMMNYNSSLLFVFPKEIEKKKGNSEILVIGSLFVSFLCIFLFYFVSVLSFQNNELHKLKIFKFIFLEAEKKT